MSSVMIVEVLPACEVLDASLLQGSGEGLGAMGRAVVGHHPLDRHAVVGKPGQRPFQEARRRDFAFVGQDFGVGQTAVVVHGQMQELLADTPRLVTPITGDAVPGPLDPSQLLGIQVQYLAGPLALVAHDMGLGCHRWQSTEPLHGGGPP